MKKVPNGITKGKIIIIDSEEVVDIPYPNSNSNERSWYETIMAIINLIFD